MGRPSATLTRTPRLLQALGLVSMLLTGCGHSPTAPGLPPRTAPSATLQPTPVVPQGTPAASTDAIARAVVAEVARTKITTKTWAAKCYTETDGKDGARTWNLTECHFRSPVTMHAKVVDSKDGRSLNTELLYHGGDDVDLKTYFFGFLAIRITLPVNDSRLTDPNHRTLKDTQTLQLMNVILHPQARVTYLGTSTVKGEAVDLIDVVSPASWSDVSHEVVGVSKRLGVPLSREVFGKQNQRVFFLQLENMRVNPPAGADDFSL